MNTLFLDLENTILTPNFSGWQDCELINIDKIIKFINNNNITVVNIFSFALHNNQDKELFIIHCRELIESAIKHHLNLIPTVNEQIIPFCCNQKNRHNKNMTFQELCRFWGKDLSFILFLKEFYKNNKTSQQIFFLDDAIEDFNFEIPKLKLKVATFNIDNLN